MEHDRIVKFLDDSFNSFQKLRESCQFCEFDYVAIGRSRYSHESWVQVHNNHQSQYVYLEAAKLRLRAAMWRKLIDESGMKTFMGSKQVEEWDDMVLEPKRFKELPEINLDNITATFEALHKDKGTMFNKSVVDVFRGLSWDYKTNIPHKFGKRIIVGYLYSTCKNSARDKINDLEKAFSVLDDKNVPDYRQGSGYVVYDTACKFGGTKAMLLEFDYFTVKTFKNGNGHITFTRPDLVDKLNKIIATAYPNSLPPKKK